MLNWTRSFGFAAILSVAMSASAQTADPPAFAFFKTFCADTRADEAAIKKAVEAAGGEVTILPDTDSSPMKMRWEKVIDGEKAKLSAGSWHFRGPTIERYTTRCFIYGFSYDAAAADALRDWVGAPPSHIWPDGGLRQRYTYTYQEAGGMKSAIPWRRSFDINDVWQIDVDLSEGISVDMWHRRFLRGTVAGQAAPTSN